MYFGKQDAKQIKTVSEFDTVFSIFLEMNDTKDSFEIHDNVIKAIRKYYGDFSGDHVDMVQEIIEKYLGEARVEGMSQVEETKEVKKLPIETSSRFNKVKI